MQAMRHCLTLCPAAADHNQGAQSPRTPFQWQPSIASTASRSTPKPLPSLLGPAGNALAGMAQHLPGEHWLGHEAGGVMAQSMNASPSYRAMSAPAFPYMPPGQVVQPFLSLLSALHDGPETGLVCLDAFWLAGPCMILWCWMLKLDCGCNVLYHCLL